MGLDNRVCFGRKVTSHPSNFCDAREGRGVAWLLIRNAVEVGLQGIVRGLYRSDDAPWLLLLLRSATSQREGTRPGPVGGMRGKGQMSASPVLFGVGPDLRFLGVGRGSEREREREREVGSWTRWGPVSPKEPSRKPDSHPCDFV